MVLSKNYCREHNGDRSVIVEKDKTGCSSRSKAEPFCLGDRKIWVLVLLADISPVSGYTYTKDCSQVTCSLTGFL